MSPSDDRLERLFRGLREGDAQAAADFCAEYGPLLQRLADQHLPAQLRRRVDPEDVVQSACMTFLRRVRVGRFQLADSESLWRLLCAITLAKVRQQARFHLRQKRGLDQEWGQTAEAGDESVSSLDLVAPGPRPDEAVAFADQLEQVLLSLDEEERQIVQLKLQEHTNKEVAQRLTCSERTVRRLLKRVQARLVRAFEEDTA
jgi:RNA polymerase sigma factor (sigma-70 family)